jgi:predicted dehydrogenase
MVVPELRVALIGGAGDMGRAHSMAYALAPIALDLPWRVVPQVLVDADDDRAARAALRLGWREHSSDWQATIARDDIDVVDIVTPPNSHAAIAIAAATHGKHVFVEKPMSNNLDDAAAMCDAVRRAGVVGQVAFNYRHTPAVAFAHDLIAAGEIGRPLQFRISYLMDAGFSMPMGWRSSRATGAPGVTGDLGSHIIDMAEYLLGPIINVSSRLASNASKLVAEDAIRGSSSGLAGFDIDDSGAFLAEFADGMTGTFAFGITSVEKNNQIAWELDGSDGFLSFDWNRRDQLQFAHRNSKRGGLSAVHMGPSHPDGLWPIAGFGTGFLEPEAIQIRNFVEAIAGSRTVSPSFADGLHVQQVVNAVYIADRTKTWTSVAAAEPEVGN